MWDFNPVYEFNKDLSCFLDKDLNLALVGPR